MAEAADWLSIAGASVLLICRVLISIRWPVIRIRNPLRASTVSADERLEARRAIRRVQLPDGPKLRALSIEGARFFVTTGRWALAIMPASALGWLLVPAFLYRVPGLVGWTVSLQLAILVLWAYIFTQSVRLYSASRRLLDQSDLSIDVKDRGTEPGRR